MRYLITEPGYKPVLTPYFQRENHYNVGMTVYDLVEDKYTTDGWKWKDIEEDHL